LLKKIKTRKLIENQRGQIMILGVLGILIVAITMLLTLNIGQSIHEKIRIQQLADSAAFSTATLEARSFNFFAYTNRANIGSLVAAASVHGYMSMASTIPSMLGAGSLNFLELFAFELIKYCSIICPAGGCCGYEHLTHAIANVKVAARYMIYGVVAGLLMWGLIDPPFRKLVDSIDNHMKYIAIQQHGMRQWVSQKISENYVTNSLIDKFAPGAESPLEIASMLNSGTQEANDGLRGYDAVFEDNPETVRWVATEIANGTRASTFVYQRNANNLKKFINPMILEQITLEIPQESGDVDAKTKIRTVESKGESRIIKGTSDIKSKLKRKPGGPAGDTVAAQDQGFLTSKAHCNNKKWYNIPAVAPYMANIASGNGKGRHRPYVPPVCLNHKKHGNFRCLGTESDELHNCFTLFKPDPDPTHDFGQPSVYVILQQDLRRTAGVGPKQPWEVSQSDSGKISWGQSSGSEPIEVQISDRPESFGKGIALSKALVYYHMPRERGKSHWEEHPNFFQPYWRAKLQPFRDHAEVIKVLSSANLNNYAAMFPDVPLP
jgi:hypothetical protein